MSYTFTNEQEAAARSLARALNKAHDAGLQLRVGGGAVVLVADEAPEVEGDISEIADWSLPVISKIYAHGGA